MSLYFEGKLGVICSRLMVIVTVLTGAALWCNDIQVTNLLDSGAGSFREALTSAEEDDCILFDAALSGTMTLLSVLPAIDEDLTILGPSSGAVIVSGGGLFPILQIGTDCTVTIDYLNLTDGATGGSGAALFIGDNSDVTVSNSSFANCIAAGTEGGAVHIGMEAVFSANDVTCSNNTSGGFGDDVFLSQGSTFSHFCSQDGTPMDVFGDGQLVKQGTAKATYTVSGSAPLAFTIEEGTVVATGVRTEPSFVYGKLMGSQTSLYIANHGIIKPSETIGTMVSTGNYYQDESATLEIAISPGSSDLLQVGGDAYLQGTLSVVPEVGTYTVGTTYTILMVGGAISNPFNSIVVSNDMVFEPQYLSDRITITMTSL